MPELEEQLEARVAFKSRVKKRVEQQRADSSKKFNLVALLVVTSWITLAYFQDTPIKEPKVLKTAKVTTPRKEKGKPTKAISYSYSSKKSPMTRGEGAIISRSQFLRYKKQGEVYLCTDGNYRSRSAVGFRIEARGDNYQLVRDY